MVVKRFTGDGPETFEVNIDWLKGIDRIKDVKSLTLHKDTITRLEVEYSNGNIILYEKVFGSWGFPVVLQ